MRGFVQSEDMLAIARRSPKYTIVTTVSLITPRDVWLVLCSVALLAWSPPLYIKVPRLVLKKTNSLTQAFVVSLSTFLCGALSRSLLVFTVCCGVEEVRSTELHKETQ